MSAPWLLALAMAQAPASADDVVQDDAFEELIVWGDRFARWERRWWVETEVAFALPFRLMAVNNKESRLTHIQVRAVLDCDKDVKLSSDKWEVNCIVEDISLISLSPRQGADDLAVLQTADAAMTGAHLQLQVSGEGGVTNVDIEGLKARNQRDRERIEGYRQLLSRVILPFHIGLPKAIHSGAKWYEYNSRLMSIPSPFGSGGSTTIGHFMNLFEGRLLVQSIGEGIVLPVMGAEVLLQDDPDGLGASAPTAPVDQYEMKLHGVAVFDVDTGIMTDRVWAFGGGLTPSSPNFMRGLRYSHRGKLTMLGQQDRPSVGPSFVARADEEDEGDAPVWVPLEE